MSVKNICLSIFLLTLIYLVGFKTGLWGQPDKVAENPVTQQTEVATEAEKKADSAQAASVSTAAATEGKEKVQEQATAAKQSQPASGLSGRVEAVQRPKTISGPMGAVEGPFALMRVTISNQGKSAARIVGFGIKLIDTNENAYSVSNSAMGTLFHLRKETFHMTEVQPGMSKTAYVVFAMPEDAVPYKLVIQPHGFVPSFEIKI